MKPSCYQAQLARFALEHQYGQYALEMLVLTINQIGSRHSLLDDARYRTILRYRIYTFCLPEPCSFRSSPSTRPETARKGVLRTRRMKRLAGKSKWQRRQQQQQQQQQLGFTGHSVEVGVNQAVITVTFRHSNTDAQAGERLAQTLATLAAAVERARIQLQSERWRGDERPLRTRPVTLGTYTKRPSGYAGQYVVVKQDVTVSPPWDTDIVKEALPRVLAPHWVLDRSVYSADLEIVVQYASQSVM